MNTSDNQKEDKLEDMENWRNEHGRPDFEFLQALVTADSLESRQKLASIAGDLDTAIITDSSSKEIMDRILLTVSENDDEGFQPST